MSPKPKMSSNILNQTKFSILLQNGSFLRTYTKLSWDFHKTFSWLWRSALIALALFYIVVELHWQGSAINRAASSSLTRLDTYTRSILFISIFSQHWSVAMYTGVFISLSKQWPYLPCCLKFSPASWVELRELFCPALRELFCPACCFSLFCLL